MLGKRASSLDSETMQSRPVSASASLKLLFGLMQLGSWHFKAANSFPGDSFAPNSNIILPYENFRSNDADFLGKNSYVIERKLFVEPLTSRCGVSTIPENPELVMPSFVLITGPGQESHILANSSLRDIVAAGYDASKRTTIIVHGWKQSYPSTKYLRRSRDLFIENNQLEHENLLFMDWKVAAYDSYSRVAASVSAQSSYLASFMMKLLELGADRMKFHLIGYSIGVHLAGLAGKRMGRRLKIGRISGLDPAGPCFGKILSGSGYIDRLGPEDAYEVNVYHYDDGFLGLAGQHGHWDIFVNGGLKQPGLPNTLGSVVGALWSYMKFKPRPASDAHMRPIRVASSQLAQANCQQVAYECSNWASFLEGKCGQCDEQNTQCHFVGLSFQYSNMSWLAPRAPQQPKRVFIATSSHEPYCLQHYQLLLNLNAPLKKFESEHDQKAQAFNVQLELLDDSGTSEPVQTFVANNYAPNVLSQLLLVERAPARFTSARLKLPAIGDQMLEVSSLEINFMSNIEPKVRRAHSSRLCRDAESPSDGWIKLVECAN